MAGGALNRTDTEAIHKAYVMLAMMAMTEEDSTSNVQRFTADEMRKASANLKEVWVKKGSM